MPAVASHYKAGYLKRVLAPLGFTNVKIVLAAGTAAVSRGQSSLEGLTRAVGPSVVALLR